MPEAQSNSGRAEPNAPADGGRDLGFSDSLSLSAAAAGAVLRVAATPNQTLHLTGAAQPVPRTHSSPGAAPAGELGRYPTNRNEISNLERMPMETRIEIAFAIQLAALGLAHLVQPGPLVAFCWVGTIGEGCLVLADSIVWPTTFSTSYSRSH